MLAGRIIACPFVSPLARVRFEPVTPARDWQRYAEAGAATGPILDPDHTAAALDKMSRNGKAQSDAAALAVARRIKAQERLEDFADARLRGRPGRGRRPRS